MKCAQCKDQCPVPQVCEVAEEEQVQKRGLLAAFLLVALSFGSAMFLAYVLP